MGRSSELNGVETASDASREPGGWLYSLPGVVAVALAYGFAHVTARLLASGNLGEDDPLDNVYIQTLAAGYSTAQLPLYDWLLWALQQVMGTGVHAFQVLKYTLLVVLAGLLFATARRVTGSPLWGFVAVEAMSLTYQIFWRVHEGFTHRLGAMVLAMATLWGLIRLLDHGRWRDYVMLGVFLGLGLVSERSYYLLLLSLLAATLLQPAGRQRLLGAGMLVALSIAALITSPYVAWLLDGPGRAAEFAANLLPWSPDRSPSGLGRALYAATVQPLLALAPFVFILPAVFPGMFRVISGHVRLKPAGGARADLRQLLLHALLLQAVLLIGVGGLWLRFYDYPPHILLPMLLVAVIWLVDLARRSRPDPLQVRRFMRITLALVVIAFLGRAANMFILDPVCSRCRWGVPYAELANVLRERGFAGGTVLSEDFETAGNLRRFFPQERFVVATPRVVPPLQAGARSGQLAILWLAHDPSPELPASLRALLPADIEPNRLRPERLAVPWQHLWKPTGYRHTEWWFVSVPTEAETLSTHAANPVEHRR